MRIFLVDMENVHKLTNVNKLTANDKLILFYSDNTPPMPMDTIKAIVDTNVSFELKRVHLGVKSALDFQLSSYLGYLLATYPDAKFIKNIKRTPPLQPQASGAIPNILLTIEIIFVNTC